MLVDAHGDADEGMLTRMRSALVNADALAAWARRVALGPCIALGRGATLGSEREQTNVLADTAEALVAAVYEARGLEGARALVHDIVGELLEQAPALGRPRSEERAAGGRAGSRAAAADLPRSSRCGAARTSRCSWSRWWSATRRSARGEGRSKRLAERAAATAALEELGRG